MIGQTRTANHFRVRRTSKKRLQNGGEMESSSNAFCTSDNAAQSLEYVNQWLVSFGDSAVELDGLSVERQVTVINGLFGLLKHRQVTNSPKREREGERERASNEMLLVRTGGAADEERNGRAAAEAAGRGGDGHHAPGTDGETRDRGRARRGHASLPSLVRAHVCCFACCVPNFYLLPERQRELCEPRRRSSRRPEPSCRRPTSSRSRVPTSTW